MICKDRKYLIAGDCKYKKRHCPGNCKRRMERIDRRRKKVIRMKDNSLSR